MQESLQIYNSLTKTKEKFKPLNPPFVGMYICGPTVYGNAHIGHARSYITFDTVFRYLNHLQYKVSYVRNITDIGHLERDLDEGNDKIQQQAKVEEISPMEVAQKYTNNFRKNMAQLNILPPTIEPYASGHIPEQISMIEKILEHGLAYIANGSVYFNVQAYNQIHQYGKLSGQLINEIRPGTRSLTNQAEKRNAADFALWKKATPTHIMHWNSPWSIGFPGWHIECSAIATKYLGQQFDIHGGGMDLLFPHHECEIAQSQASFKTELATYWMHSNLITVNGAKMGKSLGNAITLNELFTGDHTALDQPYSPMSLRFFILQGHYRGILSISRDGLKAAQQGYRKLMNGWKLLSIFPKDIEPNSIEKGILDNEIYRACSACYNAMNDDFNTAKAIAHLFNLLKKINGLYNGQISRNAISIQAFNQLRITYATFITDILGLKEDKQATPEAVVEILLTLYRQAKKEKQYNQVDFIRFELKKAGIVIKDYPHSIVWEYL